MSQRAPKGLTRIEIPTKNTFGYMVRLSRRGARVHEFFADAKHGGKQRAEAAALARYRELSASAPAFDSSHRGVITRRNTSGKVGVRISVGYGRPGSDAEYYAWEAFWTDRRRIYRTISFSWNKFGDETAYELAVIARDHETTDRPTIYSRYKKRTGRRIIDERVEAYDAQA
jgi:hypothetical protein